MSYYPVALSMCVHIHLHYLRDLHFFPVVMTTIWVFFHIMLRLQSDARFPYAFLFLVIPTKKKFFWGGGWMEARGQFPSNSPSNIIELLNYSHICTLGRISKLYGNYAIFEGKGSWNLWGNLFLIWRICKRKFWKGFRIYYDFCLNPKIVLPTDFFFF